MYFPYQYWVSVFLIFFTSILPTSSLRIGNCSTLLGNDLPGTIYDVTINAEMVWNRAHSVASVKQIQYFVTEYKYGDVVDFTIDITTMKAVHVQRFIKYKSKGFQDIVKPRCSLSFIYDYNTSSEIPYGLEDELISHAESCIQEVLCKFHSEDHRIGDDVQIISTNRNKKLGTTSQATINSLLDIVLKTIQRSLIKRTKSLIPIPKIEVSAYKVTLSSSGGVADVLKYIKRDGDMSFRNEGHRYTMSVGLRLTGGSVQLEDVSLSTILGNFVKGRVPVNTTDASFHMSVTLDYNQSPCKVSANSIAINIAPENYNFSMLKIMAWSLELTNAEKALNTLSLKSKAVSAINDNLAGFVKNTVEGLKCEDYRGVVFELNKRI